ASYDIGWLTTAVLGYLDAERIPRAVLVGNSMGGAVATETAIVEPGRVVALVLLGAAGLPEAETAGPPLSFRMLTWPVIGPELLVLERTGHIPQEERPERVVAEVTRWTDAHP